MGECHRDGLAHPLHPSTSVNQPHRKGKVEQIRFPKTGDGAAHVVQFTADLSKMKTRFSVAHGHFSYVLTPSGSFPDGVSISAKTRNGGLGGKRRHNDLEVLLCVWTPRPLTPHIPIPHFST